MGKKDIDYQLKYFKQAVPSPLFIEQDPERIGKLVEGTDTKVIAGHCRFGTKGAVTSANAHPFVFSNVTGMHNGTLSKHIGKPRVRINKDTKKKGKWEEIEETDSEAFFRFLNDHTLLEALSEIQDNTSAYAFVWYDKRDQTLNMVRNDRRPLWIAQTSMNTLYWASEKEMLEFILNRNMNGYGKNIDDIMMIPVDTHIAFDLTAGNPSKNFTTTPLKLKKTESYWGGEGGFFRGKVDNKVNPLYSWRDNDSFAENKKKVNDNVITLPNVPKPKTDPVRKENGFFLINNKGFTTKEYEALLEKGCVFCEQQAFKNDKVQWLDYSTYLCPKCLEDKDLRDMAKPNFVG
jgi:hypothetical protein